MTVIIVIMINNLFQPEDFAVGSTTDTAVNTRKIQKLIKKDLKLTFVMSNLFLMLWSHNCL